MPKLGIAPIRRQELIDAILHIVSTEGWESLTVRHVSALSGVAPGAIPHFLGTKADMVSEAIDYGYRIYQERVTDAIRSVETPPAKLAAWLSSTLSPTADTDEEWGFWLAMWGRLPFDESIRTRLAPVYKVHSGELAAVVDAGVEAGDFASGVEGGVFADQLIAMIDGLAMRCRLDASIPVSYIQRAVVQFVDRQLDLDPSIAGLAGWEGVDLSRGRKDRPGGSG